MSLRWSGIVRLGLVQAALGSVVVLVTSTLNRVMVVEYALPAMLPGTLVALHYAVQMIRPRFGHASDVGARRTPWIVGGMAVLACGGVVCALATVAMTAHAMAALALAVLGYTMVGVGVGAAGTSLLVVLAKQVDERRRAAAASIMWVLMIAGFAITSTTVGHFLDPFSPQRLVTVVAVAALIALVTAVLAVWNVEIVPRDAGDARGDGAAAVKLRAAARTVPGAARASFRAALREVWADPQARRFTLFVFVSMLAYSAEELLLEPFCGLVFGYSIGQSAKLSGLWHSAVFAGMVCVGILCSGTRRLGSLRAWTMGGCCASAVAVASLAVAAIVGPAWPVKASVIMLGVANGVFAVSAIGSMMELAHRNPTGGAGVRMGLWGAAQAVAFALGGILGTATVDVIRHVSESSILAFSSVFAVQAILFFMAARFAARVGPTTSSRAAANNPTTVIA
jgi:BCD family chlorophyll transporter-like MFS transporter